MAEGAARHPLELAEVLVVRARVGRAGDEPARAVVGDDHPVALERPEDRARLVPVAAGPEGAPEPQPQAHRRERRVGGARREVARGVDVGGLGAADGEAQFVADRARADLVVAGEAREDRQRRRVGRGPAGRAPAVGAEVPAGAGRRAPPSPARSATKRSPRLRGLGRRAWPVKRTRQRASAAPSRAASASGCSAIWRQVIRRTRYPAAMRSASRRRSRSKAVRLAWKA